MGSVKAALFCHAQWMPGSVEMEEELARRLELLEEHCRSHDIEVVARYFHVGEAGLSPKGSVARELLRAAKRGDFEWIVVESLSSGSCPGREAPHERGIAAALPVLGNGRPPGRCWEKKRRTGAAGAASAPAGVRKPKRRPCSERSGRQTPHGRRPQKYSLCGTQKERPFDFGRSFLCFFSIKLNKNNTRPEKGNKGFSYYQEV